MCIAVTIKRLSTVFEVKVTKHYSRESFLTAFVCASKCSDVVDLVVMLMKMFSCIEEFVVHLETSTTVADRTVKSKRDILDTLRRSVQMLEEMFFQTLLRIKLLQASDMVANVGLVQDILSCDFHINYNCIAHLLNCRWFCEIWNDLYIWLDLGF